jgi:hypothetical protein
MFVDRDCESAPKTLDADTHATSGKTNAPDSSWDTARAKSPRAVDEDRPPLFNVIAKL